MKPVPYVLFISLALAACKPHSNDSTEAVPSQQKPDYALVLHGGAVSMTAEMLSESDQQSYHAALDSALQYGLELLASGASSLDAVEAVICYMEDNPLFNAGRGAVFTSEGKNELDASIMTGWDLNAGAVAGVTDIRHPISAARAVMEKSPHVFFDGEGASAFADEQGLEKVEPSYFFTERRFKAFQQAREKDKHGTVGCVALDREGNLCAGTSTGGMSNKRYGRIGDSPVIGAGTYASNASCGVSATGHGEYFIRWAVAHDISALMTYKGMPVEDAATEVVMHKLRDAGGSGGVVCLDAYGHPAMVSNTPGMLRAYGNSEGERMTAIFK